MKILWFRMGWRRSSKRRRKSTPTKIERITRAALLDAAKKDPRVLAALLNKFGQIQVSPEDNETEAILEAIRAKIHKKAVDTILSSRRQELEIRIDRIIDRIIGADDRSRGQDGASAAIRHHPTRTPRSRHTQDLRVLLQDLQVLTTLVKLVGHGMETKGGDSTGKMYAVEYEGQIIEMDENEYQRYLRRRQELRTKEVQGHRPEIAGQSRLTGTNTAVPAPPEEGED